MKGAIYLVLLVFCFSFHSHGQFYFQRINFVDSNNLPVNIIPDTSSSPLWQFGKTHKSFFCLDTSGCHSMMTDTANFYPVMANNWFVLKLGDPYPWGIFSNPRIDIWHRYETAGGKDGGIVEFSTDSGATWVNVVGGCVNAGPLSTILTDSFYNLADTLESGVLAFTGSGIRHSVLIFKNCVGIKTTATTPPCHFARSGSFYFRFRFVSDSVVDSLSGWKIDSIVVKENICPGAVADIRLNKLNVFPNPSSNGVFLFPLLEDEQLYSLEVFNAVGQKIISRPYQHEMTLGNVKGLYFYKVTNGSEYYSGRLLVE